MTLSGRTLLSAVACLVMASAVSACGHGSQGDAVNEGSPAANVRESDDDDDRRGTNIGVNSFLWRATLDTLNFMPLASADPFGGVIITDWFTDPRLPNERFKATVYILDTRLRADALNVSVFRQEMTSRGWQDVQVSQDTSLQIENAILTRARQLRLSTLQDDD
jgi:hypothetical protein